MPKFNTFNVNENHLQEVLRVKNEAIAEPIQPKLPNRVHTIQATEKLTVVEWFNYLFQIKRWKQLA